jgi:hypothetical protein
MKFNIAFGAAMPAVLLSSSALAKPLQEAEKRFLMEVLKAGAIATHCPGFAFIEKSTIRLGDRYGVDGASLTDAINEALRLVKMENYDRRTRVLRDQGSLRALEAAPPPKTKATRALHRMA